MLLFQAFPLVLVEQPEVGRVPLRLHASAAPAGGGGELRAGFGGILETYPETPWAPDLPIDLSDFPSFFLGFPRRSLAFSMMFSSLL